MRIIIEPGPGDMLRRRVVYEGVFEMVLIGTRTDGLRPYRLCDFARCGKGGEHSLVGLAHEALSRLGATQFPEPPEEEPAATAEPRTAEPHVVEPPAVEATAEDGAEHVG